MDNTSPALPQPICSGALRSPTCSIPLAVGLALRCEVLPCAPTCLPALPSPAASDFATWQAEGGFHSLFIPISAQRGEAPAGAGSKHSFLLVRTPHSCAPTVLAQQHQYHSGQAEGGLTHNDPSRSTTALLTKGWLR